MLSRTRGSEGSYSPLQMHYLKRLSRLLNLRAEQSGQLNEDGVLLIDRAIYSTYCDAVDLGVTAEAQKSAAPERHGDPTQSRQGLDCCHVTNGAGAVAPSPTSVRADRIPQNADARDLYLDTSPSFSVGVSPGVPLNTRSPGSSVHTCEAKLMSVATLWTIAPVFVVCLSSPFTRVRSSGPTDRDP